MMYIYNHHFQNGDGQQAKGGMTVMMVIYMNTDDRTDFSDRAIWYRFTNPCLFFVVLISVSRLLYLFLCAKSVFKKRLNV